FIEGSLPDNKLYAKEQKLKQKRLPSIKISTSLGKRGKFGTEYLPYVVYKVNISLNSIYQNYRKRFGIESSYRLKNICRIRTTTKNPIIRLLFVGISFLLVNIWIYILWSKISKPRRGSRLVYHSLLTLKQMLAFLSNVINRIYEVREIVYIPVN
ncbi:MAG: ISH3 family transposase, partial [Prochloraceae cyanobacterium]|nr:ISH3 family transposase [Prochloraceae cyanobacterium]